MLFCHSEDVISMMHGNQNIQNKKLKLNILPISFLPYYLFSSPSIGTDPIESFRHRSHFISHAKIYEKKRKLNLMVISLLMTKLKIYWSYFVVVIWLEHDRKRIHSPAQVKPNSERSQIYSIVRSLVRGVFLLSRCRVYQTSRWHRADLLKWHFIALKFIQIALTIIHGHGWCERV